MVTFTSTASTASWLAGVKRTILKLPRVFYSKNDDCFINLALLTCFWYIICLLCKYNFVVLICALQSALCSDQSHFSRFECYPKKDKVKNILIFFGYSAKTNKSQSFIVIYFNDNESIKIYFKKSHIGIQSHFLWKETLGNLQTAPTPAKQLWFSLTFWPKQEKKENESDEIIKKQLT